MKILLDQGLPRSTAQMLAGTGVDAVHVGEIGLAAASDEAILEAARRERRVVVTLDADFHAILARTKAQTPSVIRIRIEGLKAKQLSDVLLEIFAKTQQELDAGAVVSVTKQRIRVHMLPLV
jgi:predicted nuclease of predicted toxin-antitoxin system